LKIGDLLQAAVHAGLSEHDFTIEQKRVDQPHLVLSRSTIGVIPSLGSEVICRVAEEFLCCGVPIVTLSAGALGELNLADSCFHFRDFENNIDKITDIICRSWQEDAATKIKRSEDAQKLFSLEAMGVKLSSLIDGLIVHSQVK
jgi:glycosyltransferase involved in cell wall biosynthesis